MDTLFIGQNHIFLPEVDSTNSYATELLKNVNIPEGTLISTDHQTRGRGQRGNTWNSEIASNLTVSFVLFPTLLAAEKSFYLSKIAALAVYDVLAGIFSPGQFDIKIKWPNDILVNRTKIAGILIENTYKANHSQSSVLGIGLNVNQSLFGDLSTATSIRLLSGHEHNRQAVLSDLCSFLEKWYLLLKRQQFAKIDEAYFQRLYAYRASCQLEDAQGRFEGEILGVLESGHLLVKDNAGHERRYEVKEVKFL